MEQGHSTMIRNTAESPHILMDFMQLCQCVNARDIYTVLYHKFNTNLDSLWVFLYWDKVFKKPYLLALSIPSRCA
jgi:hypothetical protein